MNRKQLTLLIVLGVVLGGLGILAWQKQKKPYQESTAKMGGKLLPDFPLNDVEQIVIRQPKAELALAKKDDIWVVKDRGDYPANFSHIQELLRKLWELKIASSRPVGPSRLPMLDLVPPEKGNGTQLDFKDKSGKVIKSVLLGAKSMREGGGGNDMFGGGGSFPNGRYVMVGNDIGTVALVTETFQNAEANAEDWLNKDWFKVEKHKSISVVTTNATNNWKLFRETETGEWKLADAKPGESYDTGKGGAVTSALGYPSFTDLPTNSAPAATGLDKPAVTATIETFDGYTYAAKIGNKNGDDNYFFQIAVAGNFPKERTPGKDEKPEDKERLDKEFQAALKTKEDKVKSDQAYSKWTYIVSKWTVDPILKVRSELLAEKKEEPKKEEPKAAAAKPAVSNLDPLAPPPLAPPPEKK
jgi:hypothetical protein